MQQSLVMAAACAATAVAVVALSSGTLVADAPPPQSHGRESALALPIASALGAGFISAAVWTFGPTAVVARGALEPDQVGFLWTALGLGGLAGAFIDRLVSRRGPATTFVLCTTALVVGSIAVLAPSHGGAMWSLLRAACFGAAYMAMSGVLILRGRLVDPRRGAANTAWLFIALAVGQATGAQALGNLLT